MWDTCTIWTETLVDMRKKKEYYNGKSGSMWYTPHVAELLVVAQFIAVKHITTFEYPLQYEWTCGMCFPALSPCSAQPTHTGEIFSIPVATEQRERLETKRQPLSLAGGLCGWPRAGCC